MKQKSYTTRRLSLRRIALKDYETWLQSLERELPKQNKFDRTPPTKKQRNRAFFKKIVTRHARYAAKDEVYIWHIFLKKTDEIVGWIDIGTIARSSYQMAFACTPETFQKSSIVEK